MIIKAITAVVAGLAITAGALAGHPERAPDMKTVTEACVAPGTQAGHYPSVTVTGLRLYDATGIGGYNPERGTHFWSALSSRPLHHRITVPDGMKPGWWFVHVTATYRSGAKHNSMNRLWLHVTVCS